MIRQSLCSFILFVCLCLSASLMAQTQVKWVKMSKALEQAETQKKKIFIDLYTDWCSWCKKMDVATFQKPDIAEYVNANFIPVKFNAEHRGEITYQDQAFDFVKYGKRGYHQLAAELSKSLGRLSFPTIIFLDENQNVIQPIPGFQDPKSFEVIMHYMGEDHFRTTPFKAFSANFSGKYN